MNESKAVEEKRDLITVPNLSSAELIRLAQKRLNLTYLDPDLAKWGFLTDEAGKTYEVMIWGPRYYVVTTDEVRRHFPEGFTGNTAAFIAYVTTKNLAGLYISIPEDARLIPYGVNLYAPNFYCSGDGRKLDLECVDSRWDSEWTFVAFREVK